MTPKALRTVNFDSPVLVSTGNHTTISITGFDIIGLSIDAEKLYITVDDMAQQFLFKNTGTIEFSNVPGELRKTQEIVLDGVAGYLKTLVISAS